MKVIAFIVAVNILFVTYRCWQGGVFDSGLERLFGWSAASDEWLRVELDRDSNRRRSDWI